MSTKTAARPLSAALEIGLFGLRHLRAAFRPRVRLRSILPMLCVMAGVSLGSLALCIGEGIYSDFLNEFNWVGLDVIYVSSATLNSLTLEDANAIESNVSNIRAVSPENGRQLTVSRGDVSVELAVWGGIDLGDRAERGPGGFRLAQGEFVTQEEDDELAQVAVIGTVTRDLLFPLGTDPLGEFIQISGVPFKVKGVLEPRYIGTPDPRSYKFNNSLVRVPYSTAAAFLFEDAEHLSINVFVENMDLVHETASSIRDLGFRRHGVEAFHVSYPFQAVFDANQLRTRTWAVLGTIAVLVLLVGNISVSIIMLMSVRVRLREIGIRMAVGASPHDIRRQFFGETLAAGVAGGLPGVVLALACLPLLAYYEIAVEPLAWFFVAPFAFALVVSCLAAVAPSWRAAKHDPVKALATD